MGQKRRNNRIPASRQPARPGRPAAGRPAGAPRPSASSRMPSGPRQGNVDLPRFIQEQPSRRTAQPRRQVPPSARRKKKRRRGKRNYTLHYILLGFIFSVTGVVLSLTVFFKIDTFKVEGNGGIGTDQLIADTGINKGDNLFLANIKRAKENIISGNIRIDGATVSRQLPSTIRIRVTLAKAEYVLYWNKQYYSLSGAGRIIAVDEKNPAPDAVFVAGCDMSGVNEGQYLTTTEQNRLATLNAVVKAVKACGMEQVSHLDLTDIAAIRMIYDNRIEIRIGSVADIEHELARVKQLIDSNIEEDEVLTIDATLRTGEYFVRPVESLSLPEGALPDSALPESPVLPDEDGTSSDSLLSSDPEDGTLPSDQTSSEADDPSGAGASGPGPASSDEDPYAGRVGGDLPG